MFNKKTTKYPKLNFNNKTMTWKRNEDNKLYFFDSKFYRNNLKNNKIVNIQEISNMNKINKMFYNLREMGDRYIAYGQGHECYLTKEDNTIKIVTMQDYIYSREFNTKFGKIICENHGEFGGALYNITDNGEEFMAFNHFEYLFEYNDKLYAITTLCHMGGYQCSLHEIKKFEDKYEDITIFNSRDLDFAGYYAEGKYLYFYSNSHYNGLYRFNLDDNKLKIISEDLCCQIEVNSLIKKGNYIYIYGNYNIVEYDLKTKKIKSIYTNLNYENINDNLYVNDDRLIDIWDKLLI